MGKRSDLTVSQRREVVLMLLRREEPAARLARRFGVSEHTLYRWRDEFLAGGEAALASGKGQHDPRDRQIAELQGQLTVIDYYSRYLLACYLTSSYSAVEAIRALELAREEAERICGPLGTTPFLVTDNGPSFIARRFGRFIEDLYRHVRIRYRTPTQLGLLERFHRTLKTEEIY
jgi:transposase-like protein